MCLHFPPNRQDDIYPKNNLEPGTQEAQAMVRWNKFYPWGNLVGIVTHGTDTSTQDPTHALRLLLICLTGMLELCYDFVQCTVLDVEAEL